MSEEVQVTTEAQTAQDAPQEVGQAPTGIAAFSEEAQRLIRELRKENAKHRKATKAAQTAAEQAAEAELLQQGEYQKVVEAQRAKLAELEPLAGQVEQLRGVVGKILTEQISSYGPAAQAAVDSLPEGMTELQKLDWLTANKALFGKPTPPKLDAQVVNSADGAANVTDDEVKEFAAKMGVDPKYVDRNELAKALRRV